MPVQPPNIAALFPSNVVSVKSSPGGGACPVNFTELHSSEDNGIIISTIIVMSKLSSSIQEIAKILHYNETKCGCAGHMI